MIESYTSSGKKGETLGLKVDLNTGRLEFTRNGVSLGLAYDNVTGPICPCVSLLKGQKITLIQKDRNLINNKNFEGGQQNNLVQQQDESLFEQIEEPEEAKEGWSEMISAPAELVGEEDNDSAQDDIEDNSLIAGDVL